jgi:hypothetical protein
VRLGLASAPCKVSTKLGQFGHTVLCCHALGHGDIPPVTPLKSHCAARVSVVTGILAACNTPIRLTVPLCELAHTLFARTHPFIELRAPTQEAHMRKIISITFVLGGIFVSVMASPNKTVTHTETVTNNQIYSGMTGIKVSLPSDLKNFPVELVPLP